MQQGVGILAFVRSRRRLVNERVVDAAHPVEISVRAEQARALEVPHEELLRALPGQADMTTGRFVEPAEVAALVAYLTSPRRPPRPPSATASHWDTDRLCLLLAALLVVTSTAGHLAFLSPEHWSAFR